MIDRKVIASILVVIVVSTVGVIWLSLGATLPESPESLEIPPPEQPPGNDPIIVTSGDLEIWAEADFWQDFMPAIPPEGPPFYTVIRINITNHGDTTHLIDAHRITIYFNDSSVPLVTLNLTTVNQYFIPPQIAPGENTMIEFTNIRDQIYSPTIDEGTGLYGRVLFVWGDGNSVYLTTPPSALLYTY